MSRPFRRILLLLALLGWASQLARLLEFTASPPAWLTTGWQAGPWMYGYVQSIRLDPDGTGVMYFGDSDQGPVEETKIKYRVEGPSRGRYRLELDKFPQQVYDFELLEGNFPVDVPYEGRVVFTRKLKFSRCPFDGPGEHDPLLLEYYGHRRKK